ncbi:helix-turn-helix transcriptional regulator [Streptomyces sp. NPDC014734]|uniref:helix-turn-helix transcriptional regulator n=1 Tax=Streptomyces sp. NPDC014734 TaxID=3364886 RepID=UPI0037021010
MSPSCPRRKCIREANNRGNDGSIAHLRARHHRNNRGDAVPADRSARHPCRRGAASRSSRKIDTRSQLSRSLNGPSGDEPRRSAVRRTEVRRFRSVLGSLRRDAHSKVIELSGEPGSGKTHLLTEFKHEAEAMGLPALSGCCAETEQHLPYRAFTAITGSSLMVQALRNLTVTNLDLLTLMLTDKLAGPGESAPRSPAEQQSASQLAARYLLMDCSRDGLVLLFDDFHWADTMSTELVEHFVQYPLDVPLLLVIAHRPRQASSRLREAVTRATAAGVVEGMRLSPLSIEQSAEVLGLSPADPQLRHLHRQSGGNPLYLRSLAGTAATDDQHGATDHTPAPPDSRPGGYPLSSQAASILNETASLTPEDASVISAVAVLGDGFDRGALAEVAGLPPREVIPAIDRLVAKDLLKPVNRDASLALRHPALRPLLHAHVFPSWRARAHRRAICLLTRRGAPAADLARHVVAAPDASDPGDVRILERAARNALWSEPSRSALWLRTALRILRESERPDAHIDLTLSLLLARALIFSGELTDGHRLLRNQALSLREQPAHIRVPAVALHALVAYLLGHRDQARALLADEPARPDAEPPVEAVQLYLVQCLMGAASSRLPSTEQLESAVRVAVAHRDRVAEAGALALRGLCQALGSELEDAGRSLTASAALLDGFPEHLLQRCSEYLVIQGRAELLIGRFTTAKQHFERGVALLRSSGHTHLLPNMLIGLGHACMRIGPLDEMLRAAAEVQDIAQRIGAYQFYGAALALRAIGTSLTGAQDAAVAARAAEKALAAVPPDAAHHWGVVLPVVFANTARLTGTPHRCVATILRSCGGPALQAVPPVLRAACFEILADAAVEAGETAAEWAASAVAIATRLPGPFSTPYATAAQAHVLRGRGDHRRAAQRYLDAAGHFEEAGLIGDGMRVLMRGAACAAASGQHGQATRMLAGAEELARRFGASQRCANPVEASHAHGDDSGCPDSHPDATETLSMLTRRESEVAALASTGTRTRDIAKELRISPKTVDVHLSRIYRKLHIHSRTELAWLIAELGGLPTRPD